MVADVLTKPLGGESFYGFANILMGWIVRSLELTKLFLSGTPERDESAETAGVR
jgi:hypothetical protein